MYFQKLREDCSPRSDSSTPKGDGEKLAVDEVCRADSEYLSVAQRPDVGSPQRKRRLPVNQNVVPVFKHIPQAQ